MRRRQAPRRPLSRPVPQPFNTLLEMQLLMFRTSTPIEKSFNTLLEMPRRAQRVQDDPAGIHFQYSIRDALAGAVLGIVLATEAVSFQYSIRDADSSPYRRERGRAGFQYSIRDARLKGRQAEGGPGVAFNTLLEMRRAGVHRTRGDRQRRLSILY